MIILSFKVLYFDSLGGACSGSAATCALTLDGNKIVSLNFTSSDSSVLPCGAHYNFSTGIIIIKDLAFDDSHYRINLRYLAAAAPLQFALSRLNKIADPGCAAPATYDSSTGEVTIPSIIINATNYKAVLTHVAGTSNPMKFTVRITGSAK